MVGLCLNPQDNALVLSVNEITQIQALDRTQPMLPLRPSQIERRNAGRIEETEKNRTLRFSGQP